MSKISVFDIRAAISRICTCRAYLKIYTDDKEMIKEAHNMLGHVLDELRYIKTYHPALRYYLHKLEGDKVVVWASTKPEPIGEEIDVETYEKWSKTNEWSLLK